MSKVQSPGPRVGGCLKTCGLLKACCFDLRAEYYLPKGLCGDQT